MGSGIKRIKSIENLGVFHNFNWEDALRGEAGNVADFSAINVIYGRNYSGKTTLSRIVRAMETGHMSDKFERPSLEVTLADGQSVTHTDLAGHGKKIRVFNEDFVRDNLHFIANPDESVEPFAILGDDNNKIEKEIHELEMELGSNEEGSQTGLYAEKIKAVEVYESEKKDHKTANDSLEKQLGDKATDRKIGIKYKAERFGDQNYNIQKLKNDIRSVLDDGYQFPTDSETAQYEKLISEKTLDPMPSFQAPSLSLSSFILRANKLLIKKISESDKIAELLNDAILNRWANEGRMLHKNKRDDCAFCGNPIDDDRWVKLDKHYDEESEKLEENIDSLIKDIEMEKTDVSSALKVDKRLFYSSFHDELEVFDRRLSEVLGKYLESLESLIGQLKERKSNILTPVHFSEPIDVSGDLEGAWDSYHGIAQESDDFSNSLGKEQDEAKQALRLKEVFDYLVTVRYEGQLLTIDELKQKYDSAKKEKERIEKNISDKEELLASKRRELNDEEKGAKKVNEYLNNFFGHRFLSLQALEDDMAGGEDKHIRFEIVRDGKKAYHLSEGESSLLAFCYFLAKLDDVDTKDSKPIIWIDDPISSLDANHIFFVYSLINAEIISGGRFEQLFISTHNLDFLKYLRKLKGRYLDSDGREKDYQKGYFIVIRQDKKSTIQRMPNYLKEYVTEFNYLFHQIYKCAEIDLIDDTNYTTFYNFGNNARKFFEIYLYYKYPDKGMTQETLRLFFGEEMVPAVLTDRINNEYSHLCGVFERGSTPVEVPEMQTAAQQIITKLKEDKEQYAALLKSVGITEEQVVEKADSVEDAQ